MKKNKSLIAITACIFLFSLMGTSFALKKVTGKTTNVMEMNTVQGKIVNEYETAVHVYPGNTIDDIVHIKNTGTSDSIIRVRVAKAWGVRREDDGKLMVDSSISTENILIPFNTTSWSYDSMTDYFYYDSVLSPDELTEEPLFESFKITEETSNDYADLTADILIKLECLQATEDAASVWNKSLKDFHYTPAEHKETAVSKVFYRGIETGFTFEPLSKDLFTDFKQLLPGETRSQMVKVKNDSSQETEIFLRASYEEQGISDSQKALIDKMLQEYASIQVYQEGSLLYEGPVSGGENPSVALHETMQKEISLGLFSVGEEKELLVQLYVDPSMGNEYQGLWGSVDWIWSAEEAEDGKPGYNPKTTPKTGDLGKVYVWLLFTVVSGIILIFNVYQRKKQNR